MRFKSRLDALERIESTAETVQDHISRIRALHLELQLREDYDIPRCKLSPLQNGDDELIDHIVSRIRWIIDDLTDMEAAIDVLKENPR